MKNITLELVEVYRNSISIKAISDSQVICTYNFHSKSTSNIIGRELVIATLTSWATIDLCFSETILIKYQLTAASTNYIKRNFYNSTSLYEKLFRQDIGKLIFESNDVVENIIGNINLNKNEYFLGYTGGKDSTLCKEILNYTKKNVKYYQVSYDDDKHADDGHIDIFIENNNLYNEVSLKGMHKKNESVIFHQADDIHVTFIAPYFNLTCNTPASLVVGLPWDVIHNFKDGVTDLVPTETYQSIFILETLFLELGINNFKVISPIASLHSLGVYKLCEKLIGLNALSKLDSCWNSYLIDGNACGTCPKCQRIKYIYNYCFDKNYLDWAPMLPLKNLETLFGSIYANVAIKKYPNINWAENIILDRESLILSGDFLPIIIELSGFSILNGESLDIEYELNLDNQNKIKEYIIENIFINYSNLLDETINNFEFPYLPFEEDYKWNRKNKILNCYGEIPVYDFDEKKWTSLIIDINAPKLKIPDLEIFKVCLNKKIINSFISNRNSENINVW